MKQPKTIRLLTMISAVLLLATAALWARGYFARDGVWYSSEHVRYGVHSYRGRLLLWRLTVAPDPAAMAWNSPATMRGGLLWDSTPVSWYAQFDNHPMAAGLRDEFFVAPSNGGNVDRGTLGFRYVSNDRWYPRAQLPHGYPTAQSHAAYVPIWAIALVTAALPGMWIGRRARMTIRRRRGLCAACGYDLRGSPTGCPECGTAQPTPAATNYAPSAAISGNRSLRSA